MKLLRGKIGFFAMLVAVQCAVPAWQIYQFEQTLRTGRAYKFRVKPIDPYDAFRGRYVVVRPDFPQVPIENGESWKRGRRGYVLLGTNEEGFATGLRLVKNRPIDGDYVAARYLWVDSSGMAQVQLPFDRFYMNERLAPQAESVLWSVSATNLWMQARVRQGRAVIEEVFVEGTPLVEYVKIKSDKR